MEVVAATVSSALGLTLRQRDSSYWGDPYFSGWPESEIKLTSNLDPSFLEGDPPEERWFSASAHGATDLVWEAADPSAAVVALKAVGLDADVVERT